MLEITDGVSGPIYSYSDIDKLGEPDRRTTWVGAVNIQPNDVAIAIHNDVAEQIGATNTLENAFAMLRDHVRENNSLETAA